MRKNLEGFSRHISDCVVIVVGAVLGAAYLLWPTRASWGTNSSSPAAGRSLSLEWPGFEREKTSGSIYLNSAQIQCWQPQRNYCTTNTHNGEKRAAN